MSGCASGQMTGDTILLHAARCRRLSHINANWSGLSDNGLTAIVDSSDTLHTVHVQGCTAITDESVTRMVSKHGARYHGTLCYKRIYVRRNTFLCMRISLTIL